MVEYVRLTVGASRENHLCYRQQREKYSGSFSMCLLENVHLNKRNESRLTINQSLENVKIERSYRFYANLSRTYQAVRLLKRGDE